MTLRAMVENSNMPNEEMDTLLTFIDHEVELLAKRSASSAKYAKSKTKANDEMAEHIVTVLTDFAGFMTIADVVEQVNARFAEDAATTQKVTYRLTKLVEAGAVKKDTISVKEEGKASRKICTYCIVLDAKDAEEAPEVPAE